MRAVMQHETHRLDTLLQSVSEALGEVAASLQGGLYVPTPAIDALVQALSTNQVPAAWAALAPHHSLPIGPAAGHRGGGSLPLGQWAKDTAARFAFFRSWASSVHPPATFRLSFFDNPMRLLVATLQEHACQREVPLDLVHFRHKIHTSDVPPVAPQAGILVAGLFLEAATWVRNANRGAGRLSAPSLHEGVGPRPLPPVHFEPYVAHETHLQSGGGDSKPGTAEEARNAEGLFSCPMYRTSARRKVLDFVFLPTLEKEGLWALRGTCIVCCDDS
ncbi:dynein heavy chain and region D6 of dynein motor-domain-containing protein [Baffinella frigidus]|nr:dynein heavy chain and region D6 of dynein motor-domain-containing protein [Cryptophyta sp. CCMP2293]